MEDGFVSVRVWKLPQEAHYISGAAGPWQLCRYQFAVQ